MITKNRRRVAIAATAAAGALTLAACSSGTASSSDNADAALTVAAAFYPLQYVAQAVGGDLVSVSSLTPAGVEPHDIELSPATVRSLGETDVVLYIHDFQPAVEDAIASTGVASFDAESVIAFAEAGEGNHEEDAEDGHDDHDHGSSDPHFWLEPALLAQYALAVGDEFATLDPDNAATYTANAEATAADLNALNEEFATGLAACQRTDIITAHEAFGYLADAFGLNQVGIAGLDPEGEPSPARLREIADIIEQTGATTVFTESLVSPRVAEAVASDAGVQTAVLDPIESVADGDDYRSVMLRNLDALREALACE